MAGDALATVIAPGARRDRAVSPGAASSRDDDPAAAMMTGLVAGLFAPKSAAVPSSPSSDGAVAAGGTATAGGAGHVIEYLTGDRSHPGYDPSHGGGINDHDHLAFRSKAERDRAAALLKSQEIVIGSMNDGKHAPNSYHYSDQAFDVPASQVPVGQEAQLSARVRRILQGAASAAFDPGFGQVASLG